MIPGKTEITLDAHAKINLFLEVGERRPDGYHDIASVMAEVAHLYDTVTVKAAEDISVTCSDNRIPTGMDNIACRAAAEFFRRTGISGGAAIHIEKRIPAAAGLAGGSTDGAAVLCALNEMYGGVMSQDELMAAGAAVGADVPFCIMGGVCAAYGIGEKLTPICPAIPGFIVVAIGAAEKMSTAEAYGKIDALGQRDVKPADGMISAVKSGDVSRIAGEMYNIFEAVTEHSSEIKSIMESCGGVTLMSGSGPAVFGLFADKASAVRAAGELRRSGFVCSAADAMEFSAV